MLKFCLPVNTHAEINRSAKQGNLRAFPLNLPEFIHLNPGIPVLGIPEGSALRLRNQRLDYIGKSNSVLFHQDMIGKKERREIPPATDISFLMKNG